MFCIIIMEHIYEKGLSIPSPHSLFPSDFHHTPLSKWWNIVSYTRWTHSEILLSFHCTTQKKNTKQRGLMFVGCRDKIDSRTRMMMLIRNLEKKSLNWKIFMISLPSNSTMRATLPDWTTTILCCYTDNLSWAFIAFIGAQYESVLRRGKKKR
jgi:hypothetical protein